MKFLHTLFLAASLLLPSLIYAQQSDIDSLKNVIASAQDDSNKVNMLIDLSGKYRTTSPDDAIKIAKNARALAEKINFPKGLGYALKAEGLVYNMQGNYIEALQVWKQALNVFEQNDIKVGAANMLNNIGVIYYNKSLEDTAQDYYLKSLKVSEEIKDTLRIATALVNLGSVYSNKTATYDKALEFYRRALPLSEAIGNNDAIGVATGNIGEIYLNKALKVDTDSLAKDKDIDSSLVYLMRAREVYKGSPNLPYALNNIGKVYREKKNYPLAIQYHQMAYDTAKMLDAKLDMGQALLGKAETEREKNDFKSALADYKDAEAMFQDIGLEESYDLRYVYEGLSTSYSQLNDFQNAFTYQKLLLDLKDKIYDLEVDKKLGTKLFGYEIGKSQAEINLQQQIIKGQKLVRNGLIGGIGIVLVFAGVFLIQRNRISIARKRSDHLLLNILPEETAEELKETGAAKPRHYEMVSVMFTDFKDFTKTSEKLSAEELVREIDSIFGEFDAIITRHRIEKIKTIGDAYMCAAGLPVKNSTHAEDIMKAAIEMQQFMSSHKKERETANKIFFELRLGIHSGPVTAGVVGSKKFAYDIWGDTVNTASRMESSGEVGKVNISQATYELVKEKFTCVHRGKIYAKNKGEIDMYFVEGNGLSSSL